MTITGKVVSTKMQKTIVVQVDQLIAHPKYNKRMRRTVRFHAHCETTGLKVGDTVTIQQVRPISKTKNWIVVEGGAK